MIKSIFTYISYIIFSITCSYGQNPYYVATQKNQNPLASTLFDVTGTIQAGNPFYLNYPAYTTFLTDGYTLENIPASKHIKGLPIGFKFPFAGQEFDIFAFNTKGYIVLGKSWEGGMTVYADTLIETATDTIFTAKNKYLISGLYPGKNLDHQGQVTIYMKKGGFEGERRLLISLVSINSTGGNQLYISTDFELKETGDITIHPYVQYQSFNNSNPLITTYASIMQRYGTDYTQYIHGTGMYSDSWFHTTQSYNNTNYRYGFIRDTIMPATLNQKQYIINYLPNKSNFTCPVPMRWNPNPPGEYMDSAYIANDHELLQGDTLSTTDRIWWYCDMRDSLRFDIYLGTDEVSMTKYKMGLMADTMLIKFDYVLGLVNLALDSLASGQKYYLKINTIHSSGDTTVCMGYSFYTKENEEIKNYCRSDELNGGFGGAFAIANMDLNTLHFHPDSLDIVPGLEYKTVLPDTGSWTTTLQQGQSYLLQLSTASWLDLPATFYIASVFIDYNGDGVFDSPANNNDNHTYGISKTLYKPLTVDIPINAVPGKTRLRVMVQAYGNNTPFPGPCEKDASIADFIITIAQATGCNLAYSDTIVSPSCVSYNNAAIGIIPRGGTAPYHIQWNTGNFEDTLFTLSGLKSPARHRAIITDAAGCNIRTNMLQVTQPAPLQVDTSFTSPFFIAFSGGTKPYRADITGDKAEIRYAVNDTVFLSDLSQGNYTITASDANDCNSHTYVISHTDTSDFFIQTDFVLYPNPANEYIQISGINQQASILIYSSDGKKVFEGNATNRQILHLSNLAPALYIVRIQEDSRKKTIKLIIK